KDDFFENSSWASQKLGDLSAVSSGRDTGSVEGPDGPEVPEHLRGPQPPLPRRGKSQSKSPTPTTTTAPVSRSSQNIARLRDPRHKSYTDFAGSAWTSCSACPASASRSSRSFCHFPRAS